MTAQTGQVGYRRNWNRVRSSMAAEGGDLKRFVAGGHFCLMTPGGSNLVLSGREFSFSRHRSIGERCRLHVFGIDIIHAGRTTHSRTGRTDGG